jgi:hypothetical protein
MMNLEQEMKSGCSEMMVVVAHLHRPADFFRPLPSVYQGKRLEFHKQGRKLTLSQYPVATPVKSEMQLIVVEHHRW